MTGNGLLQLTLYFVVLTALAVPLGRYMAAVYEGRAGFMQRLLGPVERLLYRVAGVRVDQDMSWKSYAGAVLVFNVVGILVALRAAAPAGRAAAEPRGPAGRRSRRRVQHRGELRHQHELAGLRRRDHDEPPDPDAGAHRAELRVGRDRDGGARRADPRLHATSSRPASATSGSISRARRSTSSCRSRWWSPSSSSGRAFLQTFEAKATAELASSPRRRATARR